MKIAKNTFFLLQLAAGVSALFYAFDIAYNNFPLGFRDLTLGGFPRWNPAVIFSCQKSVLKAQASGLRQIFWFGLEVGGGSKLGY